MIELLEGYSMKTAELTPKETYNNSGLKILSMKEGHDGSIALINNGKLEFALEAEKDNGYRYGWASPSTFIKALELCNETPDVIAMSGWSKGASPDGSPIGAGYSGLDNQQITTQKSLGKEINFFSSSHERSHLLCAYGMSPFPQGQPCYALLWEGHFGSFYYIDENIKITKLGNILDHPGNRFAFLYAIADPLFNLGAGQIRLSDAGKLMALTAYSSKGPIDPEGQQIINTLLDGSLDFSCINKDKFKDSPYYNLGVNNPRFATLAAHFSNALYEVFFSFVRGNVRSSAPLLISGGCGLNCDWNTKWIESKLFSDVFIPPCTNDSGSAIGTAIDAQFFFSGNAKIHWSPYSGEEPLRDTIEVEGFTRETYNASRLASLLSKGSIFGWIQGRYELGPRALGNRSLIAAPYPRDNLDRLNAIKLREKFRPIAPVCCEDDMEDYFSPAFPSPYMLEFRKVISPAIPAVTHADSSARPQSVSHHQNQMMYELLKSFKEQTGIAVLCNTSLNFNGYGFINSLSDLRAFAVQNNLDGFVFENDIYLKIEA
ncbi:carbamoyltransferase C-terminal domain-containing protein [Pseudomonas sp. KCJK8993]|uniref:carbamoyltransferase C-terminal domain-containing protein n=1 Tax=Pseudomonas sp. KCJK8993 TaxID=3344565 RepID=UPI003906651D